MFTEKTHKNGLLLGLIAAGIFLFLFSSSPVHALSFPSGITNYVQLNLSNSQTSATPNPFQQMINITSSDSGWTYINTSQSSYFGQNVEFFYSNGTIIPSWLENYTSGHALWWVKTGSIAASSTLTIYMGFASKTTNLFNNKTTGEAPQLSSTYAEYDDGADVFSFYDNFSGTNLSSDWVVGSGGSLSQNNGLTITSTASNIEASYTGITVSSPFIYEVYSEAQQATTSSINSGLGVQSTSNPTGSTSGSADSYGLWLWGTSSLQWEYYNNGNSAGGTTPNPTLDSFYIFSVASSTSAATYYVNYDTIGSAAYGTTSAYLGFHIDASDKQFIQWIRTRVYPPNGVMPSVTFGSVQSLVTITLYLNGVSNANATITYGTESNFTAVMLLSTDYVSLYVNGTKVVSLTQGKAVYLKTLAAGLYKVIAATNTSGVSNKTYYEKISPTTPTLSISASPGNFTYNGTKMTITGSISTLNNQLLATFSVNSNIGTTTTSLSYSNATANTYTAVISTSGNQNYTSDSVSLVRKISKATPVLSATVNSKALGSYTIRDANLSLSGSVSALNPLTADFYDNGKLLGASPQTILYGFSTLGNNVIVFNTSGNQNYTAAAVAGTINLTTNQFLIQDIAQNSSEISKFNLTVKNSTASKSFTNIAYGTAILYESLPYGTDTFNFSNSAYNWTALSQSNSIFTATNTTMLAKQWEWIYFNAKVSQTGLALANYTFNLSDTNAFKYLANVSSQAKLSLQKLYSGTATVTIIKVGYNMTIDKIAFTSLSPSTNTYTISVSEAALTIYVYDTNNGNAFPNATITIENGTAQKKYTNISLPFFETYNNIPIGNDTIIVTRDFPNSKSWSTSDYYITLTSHSAINLSTYIFNATYAITSTFQVQGPYGQLEANAIVYLESNAAPFNIFEECKTLGSGQCQMQTVDYTSYVYYAALPFTNEISSLSPILTSASGSGGICPTGVWCSYLSVTLLPISSIPNLNITFTPQSSFLAANENVTYTVAFSTTQNDINEIVDNYSVIINNTLVSSKIYTFGGSPTKGEIQFTQMTPNASYSGEIIENVTISQSTGISYTQFIYYVQGSGPASINNPTITNSITGIISGIGPAGGAVFFFIVFIGVTILVWIISEGAVLPTMLIDDAIMGLFAYMGVFTSVIGSYGSYFGWGLFGVFSLWTIGYQLSKIGGMG